MRSPALRGTGSRFAGDERLVHAARARDDDSVDGDALSGADDDGLAGHEGCDGGFDLNAIAQYACGLRLQRGEGAERVERAALGAGMEPVAQQKEAEDEQHGVVVNVWMQAVLR